MVNNSYKITLISLILTSLCAVIAHPFVHLLNNEWDNIFDEHPEDVHQTLANVTTEIDCYVCTFSKILAFDEFSVTVDYRFPSDEFTTSNHFFSNNFNSPLIIYLRAPPAI